jgi:hypothetical protein
MASSVLRRLHNPSGRQCGCQPDCWCKQTVWGRALRWYLPKKHRSVPPGWKEARVQQQD